MPRRSKLDLEIDELFQQPLGAFVKARNALADRLEARGDGSGAAAIRGTPKPNVAAWVVNRLARESRRQLERLIRAGARLDRLQRAGSAGRGAASFSKALEERRAALASLRSDAERLLVAADASANKTTLRRIEATLEAVSTGRGAPSGQEPGRLTRDLERPGFDGLFEASEGKADGSLALAAVRRAEKDVARRRAARDAALVARDTAAAILRESRQEVDRAARRLASARKRYEKAESALNAATRKAERAGTSLVGAEQALGEARDALGK